MFRAAPRRRALGALLVAFAVVATSLAALTSAASAHGGTVTPATRTYACRFLEPSNPACAAAWAANSQALYDWMEVNIGDAAGRHRELIPDGKLCSAGRDKYAAFDAVRGDWPATAVRPGPFDLRYDETAPHATAYFRVYVTRAGFNAATDPLRWDDLVPLADSGPRAASTSWSTTVTLPERSGRHILYVVWQRSDSPEAFYSCSDLDFGGTSGGSTTTTPSPTTTAPPTSTTTPPTTTGPTTTTTPTTTAPPTTTPTTTTPTTAPPTTTPPAAPERVELAATLRTTADWGSGWCAEGTVTNRRNAPVIWHTTVDTAGPTTSTWNGAFHPHGTTAHVEGAPWNSTLAAGATTTFGFCADRTTPPPPPAAPAGTARTTVRTTSDWGSGWCADVTVTNPTTGSLRWTAKVGVAGRLTSLWNATGTVTAGTLNASGASWNATLAAGASTTFGFCAQR